MVLRATPEVVNERGCQRQDASLTDLSNGLRDDKQRRHVQKVIHDRPADDRAPHEWCYPVIQDRGFRAAQDMDNERGRSFGARRACRARAARLRAHTDEIAGGLGRVRSGSRAARRSEIWSSNRLMPRTRKWEPA